MVGLKLFQFQISDSLGLALWPPRGGRGGTLCGLNSLLLADSCGRLRLQGRQLFIPTFIFLFGLANLSGHVRVGLIYLLDGKDGGGNICQLLCSLVQLS